MSLRESFGVSFLTAFTFLAAPSAHTALPEGRPADASVSPQESDAVDYDRVEAVLETSRGLIVIEFFHDDAPKHVEHFVKQIREGNYDGTTFHRLFKYGLVQGGDPLTKNPRAKAQYGTGGLNQEIPDEVNKNKHVTGAVSAALAQDRANPAEVKPNSSGTQFFIVVSPQPQLDSKFTVFGHVVEGMDVGADISTAATGASNMASDRIEIKKASIRERTPTVEQMKAMSAVIETSLGSIKIELLADSAPLTARAFVRYAKSGMYDGTSFYRVSQKYYMETGNLADWPQDSPNRNRFFSLWPTPFEKSDVKHVRGTVSMRQIEAGSLKWYFFIISQDNPALDGKHVPFARVIEGLEVIDRIAAAEVDGDKPKERISIKRISVQ